MFGIDQRTARAVLTVVGVVAALYFLYAIRTTLQLLAFAVFFSYMVHPLVAAAERRLAGRVPRNLIVVAVFVLVAGAIVLAVGAFGRTIAMQAAILFQELPRLLDPATVAQRVPLPGWLEQFRDRLAGLVAGIVPQALPAAQQIAAGVITVAGQLIYAIAVPIFSFLMIRHIPDIRAHMRTLLASPKGAFWVRLVTDLNFLLARYVRALALLSLAALFTYGIVLSLLGVPFALFLAGIAAVLEIIPVFGPLTAAIAILTVAAVSGYPHLVWLLLFFVVYRIFQDYMLSPYLMSAGVHVPAIAVVFGLLAGGELAGVAGIFLSVPVIAALRIVYLHVRRRQVALKAETEG